MADAQLVLNFDDAVLTSADVRLLRDARAWLNDACIGFAFKWFARGGGAGGGADSGALVFVDPAVVACARLSCTEPDELGDLARGLALEVEGTFSATTMIDKSLIDYCAPTTDGDVGRNTDDDDENPAAPEDDGWAAPTPPPTVFPTYAPTAPMPAPSPAGPQREVGN